MSVLGKLANQFNAKDLFEKSNAIGNPILFRCNMTLSAYNVCRDNKK